MHGPDEREARNLKIYVRNPYPSLVRASMAVNEVVKITSKGQCTLPVEIRRDLSLGKDSYLYVTRLGRLIVMKKVDELSLNDISATLQSLAKKRGTTRNLLMREVERAREKQSKAQAHRSY